MKEKCKFAVKTVYVILLGVFMALSYTLFVVPNDYAPAGINGLAVMVQYKLNFSLGFTSLIVNVPLCIFAFLLINKKFAINTLLYCLSYSLFYILFQNLNGLERFQYNAQGIDTIYPVLISGIMSGLAYGTLFRLDSSTGGTDVIAKFVSKKRPYLNFFWVTFALNAIVAFASFFVYAKEEGGVLTYDFKPVCLCLMYCFTSSFVGNFIIKGSRSACEFVIITTHPEEIEKRILDTLHHSATRLSGKGLYGHGDKAVLICVVNKHQLVEFENIIKQYNETFAFVATVSETIGNFNKAK